LRAAISENKAEILAVVRGASTKAGSVELPKTKIRPSRRTTVVAFGAVGTLSGFTFFFDRYRFTL
jgi:hypothetical protein